MRALQLADTSESAEAPAPGGDPSRAGGAAADIGRLFDEHSAYLCRVVHRLTGSREVAEDVVQEVFLLAYDRRHELEDRTGIRTWLYRVAVNHVRHRRRSFARYRGLLDRFQAQPTAAPPSQAASPDDAALRRQRSELIHACVQKLSEKQREVFVLYELEELEGVEIAEILNIPVNTVWSRLRLARQAFKKTWVKVADMEGAE